MKIAERPKPRKQPWREVDFVINPHSRKMTNVQRWMYRCLLQQSFTCDTRPYLPDDNSELWLLADCSTQEEWEQNKEPIIRAFRKEVVDGVSLLVDGTILEDYKKFLRTQIGSDEKGYVYFIQAKNSRRIKIGYTSESPQDRLEAMQTGSPEKLELLGFERAPRRREKELHKLWKPSRLHGEWFEESSELLQYIQENACASESS